METVRGHICPGLKLHFEEGGGCVPVLTETGAIRGCDDVNFQRIVFCPYCGEKLPPYEAPPTINCRREEGL